MPDNDTESGDLSWVLEFAGENCPQCGTVSEPGTCAVCGTLVGASDEVSESAAARCKALAPVIESVDAVLRRIRLLESGVVPIAPDQFAAGVAELNVFGDIREVVEFGSRLEALDLNNSKEIGGKVRTAALREVKSLERLLASGELLAMFDPEGPGRELQEAIVVASTRVADVAKTMLEMLTASTATDARAIEQDLQSSFDAAAESVADDDLFARIEEWGVRNVDGRIALALGIEGQYTNDLGMIDYAAVFGAFSDSDDPAIQLAESALRYLGYLANDLHTEATSEHLFLILPAVLLASLDSPVRAHSVARGTVQLMREAYERDSTAVSALVEMATSAGPLIFAAASRIAQGLRVLQLAESAGLDNEDLVLREVMNAYAELSEAHFRTLGHVLLSASAICDGGNYDVDATPPTLGEMEHGLKASKHEVAHLFAQSVDRDLRNASNHSQYRWVNDTESVEDLRTGQSWNLVELEDAISDLVTAIAGCDAGYCGFTVFDLEGDDVPTWLSQDEVPDASLLLAQALFGIFGARVLETDLRSGKVVIADLDTRDVSKLLAPLVGLSAVFSLPERIKIENESGELVLDVSLSSLRASNEAPESHRDLAVVAPIYDARLNRGDDPTEALLDVTAIMIRAVVAPFAQAIFDDEMSPAVASRAADRMRFAAEFVRQNKPKGDKGSARLFDRLTKVSGSLYAASSGDESAYQRAIVQLGSLEETAMSRGAVWPPI